MGGTRSQRARLVVVALAIMAPAAAVASPVGSSGDCGKIVELRSLHVEASPQKRTYKPGDIIRVLLEVTRPGKEDPAGQGIPMDRQTTAPAADVPAGVSIWVDSWPMWGSGITDAEGLLRLKIKVPDHIPEGVGAAYAWAEKIWRSECPDVRETGDTDYPTFVVVR